MTYGANVTILTAGLDEGVSRNGVPNAENLSPLRLTKVDAIDETTPLQYAAYDLLRLKPYSYRDSAAQSDAAESYLSKALAALTEDNGPSSALWTYWERAGSYVTDSAGQIATEGKPFGVYVFYEVKSSVGYDRDFAHEDAASTNSTLQKIGPILLDETHSRHDDGVSGPYYDLTHLELRSKAYVKILKTDENGAPLKNAEFQLFRDGDTDPIATVTTDFDGLNAEAIELDPAVYGWDTVFYFVETTPPTGYSADNGGADGTQIRFVLTRALAEETLHVERANDARLKGAVALTKISAAETDSGAVHVGDPLGGAVFELYAKNGSDPIPVYAHATQASTYRVVLASDSASILASFDTSATLTRMTTAADGKLHVEGLDWGDYYLKEVDPPTGFRLPDVEADRKVFFSVGRTNCADEQQLTMKNEPLTAMLKLNKQIDDRNAAAWGEPTFLFRIRQTHRYNDDGSFVALAAANQTTLTKAITVRTPDETGYADSTGWFAIAPGTYEITEVKVARYVPAQDSQTVGSDGLVTAVLNSEVSAVLRVRPDGRAEVTFFNQLDNYEKQSHTDAVLNRFNGWKALEVADMDGLTLTTPLEDRRYSLTIPKSNLLPKRVKADGTTEAVTAYPKLAITTDETEITVQDNGNTITVSGYREDVAGSIYRLKAVYDQKLQTTFELRFAAEPLEGKIEKRVVFRNDVQNRSYFADGGKNGTYTLIFLRSGSNATVLHNGAPLADSSAAVIPTPVIDTPYAARFEFAKWTYEITTDAATTSGEAASNATLYTVIATVDENAEILVTAVLKEKD